MSATLIDVREQVKRGSRDVPTLGTFLCQLVGEPFLFARFSYADELTLHFGTAREAKHSKLREKGIKYGSYVLLSRGSGRLLKSGAGKTVFEGVQAHLNPIIQTEGLKRITNKEVETGEFLAPGTLVVRVYVARVTDVNGIAYRVDMSDGSSVFVVPTPEEPDRSEEMSPPELADWELRTPRGTVRVGPGQEWEWVPETV